MRGNLFASYAVEKSLKLGHAGKLLGHAGNCFFRKSARQFPRGGLWGPDGALRTAGVPPGSHARDKGGLWRVMFSQDCFEVEPPRGPSCLPSARPRSHTVRRWSCATHPRPLSISPRLPMPSGEVAPAQHLLPPAHRTEGAAEAQAHSRPGVRQRVAHGPLAPQDMISHRESLGDILVDVFAFSSFCCK